MLSLSFSEFLCVRQHFINMQSLFREITSFMQIFKKKRKVFTFVVPVALGHFIVIFVLNKTVFLLFCPISLSRCNFSQLDAETSDFCGL